MYKEGDTVMEFCLPDPLEKRYCFKPGKWLVIYFYPKDNTPGCTIEAKDFTCLALDYRDEDCEIIGISPDKSSSHAKFISKHSLGIDLLSDTEHKTMEDFGVWGKKKMMGKEFFGVVRSTFLIDPAGIIVKEWRKVRVKDHAQKVLDHLRVLKQGEI